MSDHWQVPEPSSEASEGSSSVNRVTMVWPQAAPGWGSAVNEPQPRQRPQPGQTLMAIAGLLADRSTCPRGAVGCVIADARGYVIASGYNGAPGVGFSCTEL